MGVPITSAQTYGETNRILPAADSESTVSPSRLARYGEQYVTSIIPTKHLLADEGTYFVATNPTPGTVVATGASVTQAFSATAPHFIIKNNASAASGLRLYLDYIKILQIGGTAPASNTSVQYAIITDSGNRVPTSNTSTITPVSCNQDSNVGTNALLYVPNAGNPVAPAAVSARITDRGQIKGGATTVLDEYVWMAGSVDSPGTALSFAAAGKFCEQVSPVVIGPQQFILFYLWFPAGITNAFSHEFSLGWWER